MLALMGVGGEDADHGGRGVMLIPEQTVLPVTALAGGR
jgi:hypothetical protein